MGDALAEYGERLALAAHSIYNSHEDTGRGIIAGVAGVEPYRKYRERIADRFTTETEIAAGAVAKLQDADDA